MDGEGSDSITYSNNRSTGRMDAPNEVMMPFSPAVCFLVDCFGAQNPPKSSSDSRGGQTTGSNLKPVASSIGIRSAVLLWAGEFRSSRCCRYGLSIPLERRDRSAKLEGNHNPHVRTPFATKLTVTAGAFFPSSEL